MSGAGGEGGAVGFEVRDDGVEVAAAEDAVLFEVEVQLITGATVGGGIYKNGEVGVIVLHAGDVVQAADTRNGGQGCSVCLCNAFAGGYCGIYPAEVQQAVCSANFVHFGVDARGDYLSFAGEAEVFELVNPALHFGGLAYERAALHRVVHLGGVEGEGAHVTGFEHAVAVLLDAEGVSSIVYDFQAMFISNALQGFRITRVAVHMYGHDGHSFVRNSGFNRSGMQVAEDGVHVRKDRGEAVPNEGMSRGYK